MQKFRDDLASEVPTDPPGGNEPLLSRIAVLAVVGTGPKQVRDWTLIRVRVTSVQHLVLVDSFQFGGKSSVTSQDLSIYDGTERHMVKNLTKVFPHISIAELAHALIIKPIKLADLACLMIAADERNSAWVPNFQ